ncbi:hypothetical protein C8R43DRAFT_969521 [Mycena crocata]|nr:hypothetical protein C8R43DRAFT_969521 [Mycena crocata]
MFTINGVKREWKYLKSHSGGIFSSGREWNWDQRPYILKYHNSQKELLATSSAIGTVRFTTYRFHLFSHSKPATLHFPPQLQNETEKMFLIMAILQTETRRQERARRSSSAHSGASGAASGSGAC